MKEWLILATHYSVVLIDAMALLVIVGGTIEAFIRGLHHLLTSTNAHESRGIWLRYARWLVAGLTFQLAADIIETSIAPTWDDIGRLAVIAIIRTFLNYFLERDLTEVRERESDAAHVSVSEPRRELHRRLEVDHA
jgi:uncharacterized membrane protein